MYANGVQAVKGEHVIGEIMDTWTRQMGYPMVTVEDRGDSYHFVVCGVCLWLTALPSQGERTQAEVMDYLCVCGNRVAINVTQVWLTYHCLIAWIMMAAFELISKN